MNFSHRYNICEWKSQQWWYSAKIQWHPLLYILKCCVRALCCTALTHLHKAEVNAALCKCWPATATVCTQVIYTARAAQGRRADDKWTVKLEKQMKEELGQWVRGKWEEEKRMCEGNDVSARGEADTMCYCCMRRGCSVVSRCTQDWRCSTYWHTHTHKIR